MDISEADAEEYKRQDREDRGLAHLEERRRREPPRGEPCERCDGAGSFWEKRVGGSLSGCRTLCTRCLGTGVEP